jgi:hypothetical protein
MTNDLKPRNETLPATPETNSYLAYANSVASSRIVGKLLKFTKFGEFLAGEEGEEVPMGTELIVHGEEMYVGWVRWEDNRPADHQMGRLCDGFEPPARNELGYEDKSLWETNEDGEPRDPWQKSAYTIMYDPKADQIYTFVASSQGGHQANGSIARAYYLRARMSPDMFPVIRLNWSEYEHRIKRYGMIRKPIFDVVGWTQRSKIDEALRLAVGEATAQAEADQAELDYYDEKPAAAPKKPTQQTKPERQQPQRETLPKSEQGQPRRPERQPEQRQPTTLSSAARKPRF